MNEPETEFRPGMISEQRLGRIRAQLDRRPLRLLAALLLLIVLAAIPRQAAATEAKQLEVLILNSYHQGYTWSDNELDGIVETLARAGLGIEPKVEYLDSKHYPKGEHFPQLKAVLASKYRREKPVLIMTLDNPAFEFALRYRSEIAPGVPLVFVGLNDFAPAMLKGETGVTGVVERQDFLGTVRAARTIQPGLKEMVILHDATSSGLASRQEAEEQLAPLAGQLTFRYLPDLPMDGIVAALKELRPGTAVLPFSYSRDQAGRVFNHAQLAEVLGSSSPVPVYGTKVERLGHGIIGGSLLEGKTHGAMGAELALRIIRGESADVIPIITNPASRLLFDYRQLRRFGIKPASLPAGSTVVNQPPGFYAQHSAVINVAGSIIALMGVGIALILLANDRRKRAEEALFRSERQRVVQLEAANAEMEAFCYSVSHDLQAPLRHIHAFGSLLEEEYGSSLAEEGRGYLERLKAASLRMGQLISDLLDLSRISRGEVNKLSCDLGTLAREVVADLRLHDPERLAEVTIAEGMTVTADPQLLRVVLANLVGNAWKYTGKKELAVIHVGVDRSGPQPVYFVRDNGAGFEMAYVDKLFVPFQRLHRESDFGGNGIGLATVQRVINRHGGRVWAEAEPDRGATFFFTLEF